MNFHQKFLMDTYSAVYALLLEYSRHISENCVLNSEKGARICFLPTSFKGLIKTHKIPLRKPSKKFFDKNPESSSRKSGKYKISLKCSSEHLEDGFDIPVEKLPQKSDKNSLKFWN